MLSLPFLLPWHPLPIPSFYGEWLAMALGLLALALTCWSRRGTQLHIPFVVLAPVALALVILLQLALGMAGHPANALVGAGFLAWSALVAAAGRSAAQDDAQALFATLAWCMLAGGLANAACGLIQFAGLAGLFRGWVMAPRPLELYGVFGNLGQQNHFAAHLALALAALAFLHAGERIRVWPAAACAALLLTAMALSGSRSMLLYVGWNGLVWLLAMRPSAARPARVSILRLAAVLALAMGALLLAARWSAPGSQLARLMLFAEGAGPRAFFWQHALAMAAEHPFLGVGFDRFATVLVEQLKDGEKVWAIDQYAHNLALQLLAVTGVGGLAALAVPLALFVRRLAGAGLHAASMLPWAVLGILFIHSMLEQPLHYAYFLGVASYFAGAADPRAWRLPLARSAAAGLAAVTAAALAGLVLTAADFRSLNAGFYSADSGDIGDRAHLAVLGTLHQRSIFAPNAELIAPEAFVAAGAGIQSRLAFNHRLRQFAPVAEVEYRHALLLSQAGQLEAAKAQFARAARAYPEQAAVYAQRLVMMAASDPAVGKLAVFALDILQQKELVQ